MSEFTLSIDMMGGDVGPRVTVPGVVRLLEKKHSAHFILVGDEPLISAELKTLGLLGHPQITLRHTTEQVEMTELPSQALRQKKNSSMRVAINLVKSGEAQACVSAGNTGALMMTARFVLKTIPGIDRPAIMASLPTSEPQKDVRMLDLGANIDTCAEHLYQFAVMGTVVGRAVDNIAAPRIALMNIGVEEIKGNDSIKAASSQLSKADSINYIGYLEGNDIFSNQADIIVCDGFVGNVALKTMEGASGLIKHFIKKAFNVGIWSRCVGFLAQPIFKRIAKQIDPDKRNGAMLLGLNGIVVKSHGGADVRAFSFAIEEALRAAKHNIPTLIKDEVARLLEVPK